MVLFFQCWFQIAFFLQFFFLAFLSLLLHNQAFLHFLLIDCFRKKSLFTKIKNEKKSRERKRKKGNVYIGYVELMQKPEEISNIPRKKTSFRAFAGFEHELFLHSLLLLGRRWFFFNQQLFVYLWNIMFCISSLHNPRFLSEYVALYSVMDM